MSQEEFILTGDGSRRFECPHCDKEIVAEPGHEIILRRKIHGEPVSTMQPDDSVLPIPEGSYNRYAFEYRIKEEIGELRGEVGAVRHHIQDLLSTASGAKLGELQRDLQAMGPLSLNQVREAAKHEVVEYFKVYPSDVSGFMKEMRTWGQGLQRDVTKSIAEIKETVELHRDTALPTICDRIEKLESHLHPLDLGLAQRVESLEMDIAPLGGFKERGGSFAIVNKEDLPILMDFAREWKGGDIKRRIEALEMGSAHGGATDDMFSKDRARMTALEKKLLYLQGEVEPLIKEREIAGVDPLGRIKLFNSLKDRVIFLEKDGAQDHIERKRLEDMIKFTMAELDAYKVKTERLILAQRNVIDRLNKTDGEEDPFLLPPELEALVGRLTTVENKIHELDKRDQLLVQEIKKIGSLRAEDHDRFVAEIKDLANRKMINTSEVARLVNERQEERDGILKGLPALVGATSEIIPRIQEIELQIDELTRIHKNELEGIPAEGSVNPEIMPRIEALEKDLSTTDLNMHKVIEELHPDNPAMPRGVIPDLRENIRTNHSNLRRDQDLMALTLAGHEHTEFKGYSAELEELTRCIGNLMKDRDTLYGETRDLAVGLNDLRKTDNISQKDEPEKNKKKKQ